MKKEYSYLWKMALVCFILAGTTGFLFRLGVLGWEIGNLDLANIRHAHSHLMFFGWAVPMPLFILLSHIRSRIKEHHSAITWMKNSVIASFIFGLASYPFFLFYGYKAVEIGSASLPFSVMCAGLVMLSWYAFMAGYLKIRFVIKDEESTAWFDGALVLLFVCTLGAWGVGLAQNMSGDNFLLMKGLTHFFLATFTEGWLILALVAILILKLKPKSLSKKVVGGALVLITIGAPLTFPFGISEAILKPIHMISARMGGAMAATGLAILLYEILQNKKLWKSLWILPLLLLSTKAILQMIAAVILSEQWLADHNLRIFYLHIVLLGAFTLSMILWLGELNINANKSVKLVIAAILGTLLSLLLPTVFFPAKWSGFWIHYVLAIFAFLPVIAVSLFFRKMIRSEKMQH